MAWMSIESWLAKKWSQMIAESAISGRRKKRLEDGRSWTAEVITESLGLLGKLDDKEIEKFSRFRRTRNDVVHESYNPVQAEALQILEAASEIAIASLADAGVSIRDSGR